jgi:hypothetical protein
MHTLGIWADISSIAGVLLSLVAAIQAWRASNAASAARDAVLIRSLADDLKLACSRGEQLVDFIQNDRYREACLRVDELTWTLSELPHRHSPHLSMEHKKVLLTSRQQLQTIVEAIANNGESADRIDKAQVTTVARRVTMRLCEVLGDVRSSIEQGEKL